MMFVELFFMYILQLILNYYFNWMISVLDPVTPGINLITFIPTLVYFSAPPDQMIGA